LVSSEPEPLTARFQISHGMLLSVLGRPQGGCHAMKRLVQESLETAPRKRQHKKHALELLRSLWQAGVIEFRTAAEGGGVRLNAELQQNFSLLQALGLYVVDAVERLLQDSPSYALDVLTLVEAIVEDPEVILRSQVDKLKGQKVAELKAAGVEYEERMIELDKVEHPKPNLEFLNESFAAFANEHPWVSREVLKPKSIAREMLESLQSFSGYIKEYGLARSEGLLLRYLTEVYKTLVQSIPELARTAELEELIETLGVLVRGVDSSLLDEWERLKNPAYVPSETAEVEPARDDITQNTRVFTALIRNLLFSILRALQDRDYDTVLDLAEVGASPLSAADLERAMRPFFEEGSAIQLDAQGRSPQNTQVSQDAEYWEVNQAILVNDEISEYAVRGRVDIARSAAERRPVFLLDHVGAFA
jgi:Domain of unknown function (DUF3516)